MFVAWLIRARVLPCGRNERLNAAVVRIVNEPAMSKFLSDQGAEPWTTTPAEYAAYEAQFSPPARKTSFASQQANRSQKKG